MATATALEEALGVTICDRALLTLALTHRSYAFEAGGLPHNERLEFLGDAVLGLVVTRRLYVDHPDVAEGRLAKLRAATVSAPSLARIARRIGVGDAVLLGRGEEQSGGRDKDSILADTLEALIGAVFLDRGLDAAVGVVEQLVADRLADLRDRHASLDYKTALQELVAARELGQPVYRVRGEGPDHARRFSAEVEVDRAVLGRGAGTSKKAAEQAAAEEAYVWLDGRGAPADPR